MVSIILQMILSHCPSVSILILSEEILKTYSADNRFYGLTYSIFFTKSSSPKEYIVGRLLLFWYFTFFIIYSILSASKGTLRQHISQISTPNDQISHFSPQNSLSHTQGAVQRGDPIFVTAKFPPLTIFATFMSPTLNCFSFRKMLAGFRSLWMI